MVALLYATLAMYCCAIAMTIAHGRVNMEKYPPLPDLFLDNVPYMPWAFTAAEYICLSLFAALLSIIITHKHRYVSDHQRAVNYFVLLGRDSRHLHCSQSENDERNC